MIAAQPSSKWKQRFRLAGLTLLTGALVASPWWGPKALSRLSFFRLQRVEVHGLRYLPESELLATLGVDTTHSLWTDLRPLQGRLLQHPQLHTATLSRKLPGTLVVRVTERQPLALVAGSTGFTVVDSTGAAMSVDPSLGTVDVPILWKADSALVRLLSELRDVFPPLYSRVGEVVRVGNNELKVGLGDVKVLAMSDVTADRLLDILPVERHLAARGVSAAELDLRYRGQVIVRPIKQK
jgi:cell division protein FtsQ